MAEHSGLLFSLINSVIQFESSERKDTRAEPVLLATCYARIPGCLENLAEFNVPTAGNSTLHTGHAATDRRPPRNFRKQVNQIPTAHVYQQLRSSLPGNQHSTA